MQFEEVRDVCFEILRALEGRFTTPYQICRGIERTHLDLWRRLLREYPSAPGQPPMGEGAGTPFSPASFVALALNHFHRNGQEHLMKESFDSTDVNFVGVDPGFKGGWISIWAWQ